MATENTKSKERIDELLVKRGFSETRSKAKALLMAGSVFVDGHRVEKAGAMVAAAAEIELKGVSGRYVGRGGVKLEAALKGFGIDPGGKTVLDVGASTGGFTDCLLQHGALVVYAVDVGYGQLAWSLRNDPRVRVLERLNARYLKLEDIGERVDIATFDVSFISLTLVIPPVLGVLKPGGVIIALVKPQFEVGKGEVGRGGIVRDEAKRLRTVKKIEAFVESAGLDLMGVIPSPIPGADGNREYLLAAIDNR